MKKRTIKKLTLNRETLAIVNGTNDGDTFITVACTHKTWAGDSCHWYNTCQCSEWGCQ